MSSLDSTRSTIISNKSTKMNSPIFEQVTQLKLAEMNTFGIKNLTWVSVCDITGATGFVVLILKKTLSFL